MQSNRRTRFALLVAVLALVLTGVTVSPTTSGLTDEEVVRFDEIEAATDWNESPTANGEPRPNETLGNGNGSTDGGNEREIESADSQNRSETEQNESGNRTEAKGNVDEELDDGITADGAGNVSETESNGRSSNETAPNTTSRR